MAETAVAGNTTTTTDLPDWAKGYAQNVLAKGQAPAAGEVQDLYFND